MRKLCDTDVREAIHAKLLRAHRHDPKTLVIDELGLRNGDARVDVGVVNGELHGYEIKSDRDTLDRLAVQVPIYSEVLDRVTLVVGSRHAADAERLVPAWWGLKLCIAGARGAVHFRTLRRAQRNPGVSPVAVAELLWRDEALALLEARSAASGHRGRRRHDLYGVLAEVLPLADLRDSVRDALRARRSWRSAWSRM